MASWENAQAQSAAWWTLAYNLFANSPAPFTDLNDHLDEVLRHTYVNAVNGFKWDTPLPNVQGLVNGIDRKALLIVISRQGLMNPNDWLQLNSPVNAGPLFSVTEQLAANSCVAHIMQHIARPVESYAFTLAMIIVSIVLLGSGTQIAVAAIDLNYLNSNLDRKLLIASIVVAAVNVTIALVTVIPVFSNWLANKVFDCGVTCWWPQHNNDLFPTWFFGLVNALMSLGSAAIFIGIDLAVFLNGDCDHLRSKLCLKGQPCPSFSTSNESIDLVFESFDCGLRVWNLATSFFMFVFMIITTGTLIRLHILCNKNK